MKNRAKCKLCQSIIESFHPTDYVLCKCGEIAVDGGEALHCYAKSWDNFLRVDDEGNEIEVIVRSDESFIPHKDFHGLLGPSITQPIKLENKEDIVFKRTELLKELDEMIKYYENLPKHVLHEPVSHCDLLSALMLLSAILRA